MILYKNLNKHSSPGFTLNGPVILSYELPFGQHCFDNYTALHQSACSGYQVTRKVDIKRPVYKNNFCPDLFGNTTSHDDT